MISVAINDLQELSGLVTVLQYFYMILGNRHDSEFHECFKKSTSISKFLNIATLLFHFDTRLHVISTYLHFMENL